MINLNVEVENNLDFINEKFTSEILNYGLDYLDFPFESEINVLIVDSSEIKEINNSTRGLDKATDVLSFPMNDIYDEDYLNFDWTVNPDTEEVVLGDIVINIDYVRSQAKEYGHSEKESTLF